MSASTPNGYSEAVMAWTTDMPIVPGKFSQAKRVGWRLVHRLGMPRGAALGHPNDGKDVTDASQDTVDARSIASKRAEIHAEVLKDPSVTTAFVTLVYDARTRTETITIKAFGPFGSVTVGLQTLPDGTQAVSIV